MADYEFNERVAIKQDSHISEREAIIQTKREMTEAECILKVKALQNRMKQDRAEKQAKKSTRFRYD